MTTYNTTSGQDPLDPATFFGPVLGRLLTEGCKLTYELAPVPGPLRKSDAQSCPARGEITQPDYAVDSPRADLTTEDRSGMIDVMTDHERSVLLSFIAGFAPGVFDAAVASRPSGEVTFEDELWDRVDAELAEEAANAQEAYCTVGGGPLGIFRGHGDDWHHYRGEGTVENPNELLELDHEPAVAWRYPDETT